MSCYNCKAKYNCASAVEEGSVICKINKLHYGGTHGEEEPKGQEVLFCQYCGKPLKIYGSERFCNNVFCHNRYINV